jgi:hypothetical protein
VPDAQALCVPEALGDWQGEALGVPAPEVACGDALGEIVALWLREPVPETLGEELGEALNVTAPEVACGEALGDSLVVRL